MVRDGVTIGDRTVIEASGFIGEGTTLGDDCLLYAGVKVYHRIRIGNRVIVHAGSVIGSDGFGYVQDGTQRIKIPQIGDVVIEDDVEIGANVTIDRATMDSTVIKRGTKIDNLIHVGHNCDIGEDVILVALTGISGSSTVGKGAVIAGQVGIGDHAHIGPGVILGGQAGVLSGKTVTNEGLRPGTVLWGTPARPLPQVLREIAIVGRMAKRGSKGPVKSGE